MAISLVEGFGRKIIFQENAAGVDDGNERIFILNPALRTALHVVVPSAGEYQVKLSAMDDFSPTNFTGFADVETANLTTTKLYQFEAGLTAIGVDVVSGAVDVYVRQV